MYAPTPVPTDAGAIPQYLATELQALAQSLLNTQEFVIFKELNVAPAKPRKGMVCLADGTNWNPGAGAGLYVYRGAAWHLLG